MPTKFTYYVLLSVLFFSCSEPPTVTQREGNPDIYNYAAGDADMSHAVEKAQKTFYQFYNALRQSTDKSSFTIKVPFNHATGREHIWITQLELVHDSLFGRVSNEPESTKEVKLGQRIYIDTTDISDWYYVRDGKLVGGFTVRISYDQMSDEDKKKTEASLGCKIE